MMKDPVSFVIGVGIASGAADARRAPVPTVVNTTAPDPAAFKKFLREYFIRSSYDCLGCTLGRYCLWHATHAASICPVRPESAFASFAFAALYAADPTSRSVFASFIHSP